MNKDLDAIFSELKVIRDEVFDVSLRMRLTKDADEIMKLNDRRDILIKCYKELLFKKSFFEKERGNVK